MSLLSMVAPRFFRLVHPTLARRFLRNVALLVLGGSTATGQLVRVANSTLTLPQNPQTFGYRAEDAFAGITFSQPLGLVVPPGETDRLFVIEKTGRIQVIANLGSTPVKQLFLDLTSRVLVNDSTEEGLLGLAFHPDFATNRYFYVFYTTTTTTSAGTGRHDRLSRFTALASPATNADILATEVPMISQYDEASNHNGGDLHFGSDGYLYVSLGDEGGGNDSFDNSQRIDKDFFSGMLRIDVDRRPGNLAPNSHASVHAGTYAVPADNPFVGATSFNGASVVPSKVHTEYWAVGLRNPWRFSIDAPTGRIIVGDVGQDTREEVDLITRGGNYGWNYREGTIAGPRASPPAGAVFIEPLWDTDRNTASSITGGVVYRGTRFAQLFGKYVYGDYPSGRIFAMTFPASGPVQVQTILTDSSPAGFGADPRNGDILFASIGTGKIRRLVYDSTATGTSLPATLSATGAFSDLASLSPSPGVVPYSPNISFWSDYAVKRRWFSVPALADKITFDADGNWTFPAGTVWVKHFDLELTRGDPSTARRLETRFIVKTASGVYGVTYRWNTAQTEATLVPEDGATEAITINDGGTMRTQTWRYPSRAECLQCHTPAGGQALSFNTAQLNRSALYGASTVNQLSALAAAGYFTSSIPDPTTLRALAPAGDNTATIEYRARSYLAANCSQCHQPGGPSQGYWDARIATPTNNAGIVGGPLVNQAGDSANRVIAPGDTAHSMLLTRIGKRGTGQMPPLASNELDQAAINLITSWINGPGAAPAMVTQPVSQTAVVGRPVTFTAAATGVPAPVYQWRKNGANISGATGATYTIASAALGDAGTYTVVATNNVGAVTSAGAILAVFAAAGDFNSDGKADLLWQNTVTGQRSVWLMNGTVASSGIDLGTVPTEWVIAGTADFTGDGQLDLLWQNTVTGQRAIWAMNGTTALYGVDLGIVSLDWWIAGVGDFNADGKPDILWTNTATNERAIWLMNGTTAISGVSLGIIPFEWLIAGAADFNLDGQTDILWSNILTGERSIWLMNGTSPINGVSLGIFTPRLQISGTGDYNGDGYADILLSDQVSGARSVWLMNGTSIASTVSLGTVGPEWILIRPVPRRVPVDFNADSKSDVVWQNTTTGERSAWLMNGTTALSGISLGTRSTDWEIAATGDFNTDGRADLVWQNNVTGERNIWLMNGGTKLSEVALATIPVDWKFRATGDFNLDGVVDLVLQNTTTGECVVWFMNGATPTGGVSLGVQPLTMQIVGCGDFNADSKADLVWTNTTTGERSIWLMNGATMGSSVSLGVVPLQWAIAGTGDFDQDGNADLVWQNTATGERSIWLMNGTSPRSGVSLGTAPTSWSIRN